MHFLGRWILVWQRSHYLNSRTVSTRWMTAELNSSGSRLLLKRSEDRQNTLGMYSQHRLLPLFVRQIPKRWEMVLAGDKSWRQSLGVLLRSLCCSSQVRQLLSCPPSDYKLEQARMVLLQLQTGTSNFFECPLLANGWRFLDCLRIVQKALDWL